ncbi:hypothetical protein OJAV_G00108740 [Oryzias javanicus]|uniref:Uncharacterized protein n=1 Tax=Oryzias javanicus TaxID=123683 RepID=A0A3S2P4R5_ORYJA|nr:hypothetical protein OJAV_G00108740 [Oryzias javanicus]
MEPGRGGAGSPAATDSNRGGCDLLTSRGASCLIRVLGRRCKRVSSGGTDGRRGWLAEGERPAGPAPRSPRWSDASRGFILSVFVVVG